MDEEMGPDMTDEETIRVCTEQIAMLEDDIRRRDAMIATLRARVAELEAALRDLLDYTLQIEHFVYPEDEANIDHEIVAVARRALAAAPDAPDATCADRTAAEAGYTDLVSDGGMDPRDRKPPATVCGRCGGTGLVKGAATCRECGGSGKGAR